MVNNKRRKKIIATIALVGTLLFTGGTTFALTLADIELLIALGIISGDQADIAREAVSQINQSSTGETGVSVRTDEFSSAQCLLLNQNLVPGVSGSAVSALQTFLETAGHYVYPEITGFYGSVTQTAVTDFQLATGLITSSTQLGAGSVGPLTRQKIQEVSCGALNTPEQQTETITTVVTTTATSTTETSSVKIPRDLPDDIGAKIDSLLIHQDREDGIQSYRYDMEYEPDNIVDTWRVLLVCDGDQVDVNRLDLTQCGGTADFRASSKGTASFRITYQNLGRANQTVGIGVEALDDDGNVLDEAEVVNQLPPADTSRNLIGSDFNRQSTGEIPEQRVCDYNEQLQYLRYIMTRTIYPGNPISPPVCWPGNVQCTFDTPPSRCIIANGPSSDDLCSGGQYFYDGLCRDIE